MSVTQSVSSGVTSRSETKEDDDDGFIVPRNREEALSVSVGPRATLLVNRPPLAAVLQPESWPEVLSVAQALARAAGLAEPRLGRYQLDAGVRKLVELYAIGFTQIELEHVARAVPKQPWWSTQGKRLGLSSLSVEVVRRNLPGTGPPRQLSPTVAKVLDSVRQRREAG